MLHDAGGTYLEGRTLERAAQWLVDQGHDIPSSSAEIAEIIDDHFDGGLHWFIASAPARGMNELTDPRGPDESSLPAGRAGSVVVGDQAQHGQMPASVGLPDRGESEVGQGECGVETGRGKVVHEGPWVVMES